MDSLEAARARYEAAKAQPKGTRYTREIRLEEAAQALIAAQAERIAVLEAALRATTSLLDTAAARVFVMGKGHQHWDDVQARIDANRALLALASADGQGGEA